MVHQHFRLVEPFSVAENVVLGDHRGEGRRDRPPLVGDRAAGRRAERALRARGEPARRRIWQLSVGEQQRVEILKALYRDARILIMDEPTAVLTPQEAEMLFQTLRAMAAEGKTVIFISHKLHEVMAVADRVTVLRGGRTMSTVSAAESTQRSLASLMVGREIAVAHRMPRASPVGDVIAGGRGRERHRRSRRTGREGRLARDPSRARSSRWRESRATASGSSRRPSPGSVTSRRESFASTVVISVLATHALRSAAGVAYVPEDRLGTGLAPSLSVAANVVLKSYRAPPVSRGPVLMLRRMRELAVALLRRYDVKAPGPDTPVRNLSGGNLQKLVLGREFEGERRALVAAQPTRGLDVGAIETVHGYLREAAAKGLAVLLISEDLDEIRALADRILVMYEGEIRGELDAETATIEELGFLMAGGSAAMIKLERRLEQPWWLSVAVPVGSLVVGVRDHGGRPRGDGARSRRDVPEDPRGRIHRERFASRRR